MPGELLSTQAADKVEKLVKFFEHNPPAPHQPPRPRYDSGQRPPLVGILLNDLVSGGTADCACLALFTNSAIQRVKLLGYPTGGTFTLSFTPTGQSPQTTISLAWNATAAQVQAALEALPGIGKGNVSVTLGQGTYTSANTGTQASRFPGLWTVSFINQLESPAPALLTFVSSLTGPQPSLIVTAADQWLDTGRVETVRCAIPVGTPTPLRAGATILSHFVPGAGYCVGSCEPRQFGNPY